MNDKLTKNPPFAAFPMLMSAFDKKELFIPKEDIYAYVIYYMLSMQSQHSHWWGTVETTVVTLSKQVPIKTKVNKKKESDNRKEIKHLLLSLNEKGYIEMEYNEDTLEYDTLLTIKIPDANGINAKKVAESYLPKKTKVIKHQGWVGVSEEMFKSCNGNPWFLRILIYSEWRKGIDYRISFEEWACVLGSSENTAAKYLNEANELNLIDKISGEYYADEKGEPRQLPNKYKTVSAEERKERERRQDGNLTKQEIDKQINIVAKLEEVASYSHDPRIDTTYLLNTGWLTPACWHVWHTTEFEATKEIGDKRFNALRKINPSKYNELEKEGRKLLAKEESRVKREASQKVLYDTMISSQMQNYTDYEPTYEKKETKDYAHILD
ncbi:hypothetical protein PTQ21_18615 [Paenibacillus marchantiae]|uniref:hypothetical protein n=1 Tax=Paenibacillus marchantiae TaxID=3026433 RepID=UPI00237A93CB|nr:hypothetical protein [Paenibacillus marchantiae]WDQ30452.1 hypothetical protein PTQ21_18615 [Paenibacillus marchantiae]